MKEFTVLMALVDMVPVIMFAIGSVMLQRDLYDKMSKGAFALFATGTINIVSAGLLKALYKLLYAANVCDFEVLSKMFFPTMSIGFLMAGLGLMGMLFHKQGANAALSVAPPLFTGTMIFVTFMVLGSGMIYVALSVIAVKLKKRPMIALFVLGWLSLLCMGYLSSKDFAQAYMNWVAEGVNFVAQGAFLTGVILLRKAGLSKLKLS